MEILVHLSGELLHLKQAETVKLNYLFNILSSSESLGLSSLFAFTTCNFILCTFSLGVEHLSSGLKKKKTVSLETVFPQSFLLLEAIIFSQNFYRYFWDMGNHDFYSADKQLFECFLWGSQKEQWVWCSGSWVKFFLYYLLFHVGVMQLSRNNNTFPAYPTRQG